MGTGLKVFLIVFGILAVLGIGLGVLIGTRVKQVSDSATSFVDEMAKAYGPAPDAAYKLEITDCTTDSLDNATAKGTIKNTSGKRHGFNVEIGFYNSDNTRLGSTMNEFIDAIDDGKSATFEASGFETPKGDFTCKLESVKFNG